MAFPPSVIVRLLLSSYTRILYSVDLFANFSVIIFRWAVDMAPRRRWNAEAQSTWRLLIPSKCVAAGGAPRVIVHPGRNERMVPAAKCHRRIFRMKHRRNNNTLVSNCHSVVLPVNALQQSDITTKYYDKTRIGPVLYFPICRNILLEYRKFVELYNIFETRLNLSIQLSSLSIFF